jgi:predicted metal-dependent hydrolase
MTPTTRIIRTRRKTIALIIEPDGNLLVRAPLRASDAFISELITKKASWIAKKQREVRSVCHAQPTYNFKNDEEFRYLGKCYSLKITTQSKPALYLEDKFYLSARSLPRAKSIFTNWYKKQARQVLEERVSYFANLNHLHPKSLRITSARRRWGSCGARGSLNFSWRLVMAPIPVIDYVVIHELVHLLEKNHSRAFWSKVNHLLPEYKEYKRWLEKNGSYLTID